MSDWEMSFPEDLLGELLGTSGEEMCIAALEDAAPIMVESMKKAAKASVLHEGESEMVNSIRATKPKMTKDGDACIVNVGPTGESTKTYRTGKNKEKQKVSNALKAVWKEYGIAGKQAPRPFIANATKNAEERTLERMRELYRQRVGGENGSE